MVYDTCRFSCVIVTCFTIVVFDHFLFVLSTVRFINCDVYDSRYRLDFIETRGRSVDDLTEVFELISESKFLSKPANVRKNTVNSRSFIHEHVYPLHSTFFPLVENTHLLSTLPSAVVRFF